MKIYNIPGVMQSYKQKEVKIPKGISPLTSKKDQMQVSNEAQLMSKILQVAKNSPEIREEKVYELKNAIKQGTYNISAEDVAEKMLKGINFDNKI